jgi:AcrR family transcriptional regulator
VRQPEINKEQLIGRCLAGFIQAGTLDLSLDRLAEHVGISKRMLLHYFRNRDEIEERAMTLLEERLRAQFAPAAFPRNSSPKVVMSALWEQTTSPQSRGVLLLIMDVSKRAWSGSARAKSFYAEQWNLWRELIMKFLPDKPAVEELLQLFQGAVLGYLITGDPQPGKRSLMRALSRRSNRRAAS